MRRCPAHTGKEAIAPSSLFLFGHDLRLGDHAGLAEAARFGDVVPALVLDDAALQQLSRTPRRAAFYCAAVASLDRDLRARGSQLVVRRARSVPAAVRRLLRETESPAVSFSAAYGGTRRTSQSALQAELEEAGVRATIVHDAPAVSPDETAAARVAQGGLGYRALVPFAAVWHTLPRAPVTGTVRFAAKVLASDALPTAAELGGDAAALVGAEAPSEAAAQAALQQYLAGSALHYLSARNIPSGEPTSRLSALLSFGVISARTVAAAVDERERDAFLLAEERLALRAFRRALAERDFFLQLAWFFAEDSDLTLQSRMRRFPFAKTHAALGAWREGRTGYPLVDAGMRELRATGWMHPRVRLVAASFLCFDLGVDWRVGRDAWDRELVEDDAALATGNWQWVAGVGADLAQFPRIYNPRKQARAFDPAGTYVRRWIPELAAVPDQLVFDPSVATRRRQLALPLFDGSTYPPPVVDHEREARAFLQRYKDFVQDDGWAFMR